MGVEVFFVVSGFVITSPLVRELGAKGRTSFMGFYAPRARRILAPATPTTVMTGVAAGLLLSPLPALRMFADTRAAAVFGASIHFAQQGADYFNDNLTPSPIQHYWSLSVEEQFYFVRVAIPITWVGVALIVVAALAFDDSTPYPGSAALLPLAVAVASLIPCARRARACPF